MARRVLVMVVAVGLLVIGVGRAAVSSSRWSAPALLAAGTGNLLAPVGVGTSRSIVAWASSRGVFAAVAGSAGRFGRPERLAAGGLPFDLAQPLLATDARGDAIVIWQRPYSAKISTTDPSTGRGSLFASYRPAGGPFGAAHLIARNAKRAIVAMDAHGNALVAWLQTSGPDARSIDVLQRSANGSYGPTAVLATGAAVILGGVAMDPGGDAVVVWESASAPPRIEAATREHGGAFGAPVPIGAQGVDPFSGSVAIDRRGRALIAWDRLSNGAEESVAVTPLQVGATAPGASQTLRGPGHGTPESTPVIESDLAGDAVVTWQTIMNGGRRDELVAARSTAGRPFAPGVAITPAMTTSYAGGLFASAIGPAGATIVAWDSAAGPVRAVVAPNATSAFKATTVVAPASDNPAVAGVGIGTPTHVTVVWWNQNQHRLQYVTAR